MRTYAQAVAYAQACHDNPPSYVRATGHCQQFARSCVGADGWANSAIEAWHAIPAQHRHSGYPQAGGIAYFDRADIPDNKEFGHAVFVITHGNVWSTDALRSGQVDVVPYTWFAAHWGMRYLGWIDWTPSGLIRLRPTDPAVPPALAYRQGKKVYRSKLRVGQANSDSIWNLILGLRAHGYPTLPTGTTFTSQVRNAVAAFQRRQNWTGNHANGIPDHETIGRLGLIWVDA